MLCCLLGGLLVAALARSARRRQTRPHNRLAAAAFGFGGGMLVVELIIALLVPLGSARADGALAARLAVLAVPAVLAGVAGWTGAAGSLATRAGVTTVTAAAVAGAVAAEELDLHLFGLHSAAGLVAGVAIHVPAFLVLAGGLWWRSKLLTQELPGAPDRPSNCHRVSPSRGVDTIAAVERGTSCQHERLGSSSPER